MNPRLASTGRRHRIILLALLALALTVRVAWGMAQPTDDRAIDSLPDQREYLSLAQNLLAGHGLQFYDPRFRDVVHAYRTPGYPLWIAAFGAKMRLLRFAQAALDTSTVLATYLLARALLRTSRGPAAIALTAAGIVAVNPLLICFTGLLLSETLFTALLAWGMLLLVVGGNGARLRTEHPDGPRPPRPFAGVALWLAGGLVLALSGLVRPSALPLPVVLGISAVFLSRPDRHRLTHQIRINGLSRTKNCLGGGAYDGYAEGGSNSAGRARQQGEPAGWPPPGWPLPVGATMLLLTLIVLLPWGYRNFRLLGQWVWTTTNEGVTAYDGFNPDATGASDQSFLQSMPQLQRMDEVGRSRYLADKAKAFIRAHPDRVAELAWVKAKRTWSPVPLSREYGDWKHSAVALAYSLPLDILVLAGLIGPLAGGFRRAAKVFLLLPAIYFTAVHVLSVGSLRYRIPVEAPMAVIAAGTVGEVRRLRSSGR